MTDHREKRSTDRVCVATNSETHESNRYQRLLQGINRILTQAIHAESEEALGNVCLAVAMEVTDSAISFLAEVDPDGRLHPVAVSERNGEQGRLDPAGHRRPPPASMLREFYSAVVTEGKSLLANDLSSHRASVDLPPDHLPLTTLLGVPLIYDGRTVGVLSVANRESGYGIQQQEDLESLTPTIVECLYRRRAEEELRTSEKATHGQLAEIDSIYRSALVGLCVFDDQLRYVRINECLAEMNGIPPAEHIGRTLREVLPDLADQAEALLRQILDTGEPMLDVQVTGMTPAQPGVLRTWIAQWLPIKDAAGRVVGVNVVTDEITERLRTEEALRKSETRWRALATTGSNVLYVMSPDWREMCLLQGGGFLADTETLDATWLDKYIPPDDQPHVNAVIQEAIRTKSIFDLEHHVRQADGSLGWTHSRAVPVLDAHGDIIEWFGAARDVTARRQAEEALRESEGRFRRVLENSRDIVFGLNLRTYQYEYLSPAIAELTGFTAQEFMAAGHRKMLKRVHREDRERYVSAMKASWQSPDASSNYVRYRFRHKDGAYRWLSNSWTVVMDDEGQPLALVGTTRDVTEAMAAAAAQRTAEEQRAIVEAVKRERQRLLDVLETLPAMICLLTPDHRIAFANRAFREKFGVSQGRHCYERCFGRAEPCAFCEAYRVLETGQPHHWEVTLADGTIIDVYNSPFTDVDGTPMILEMNTDITEGRRAQEALVQAERMAVVGRMAATLTHEINNPLQAVVGCLGLAMEVLPENQDADRYLNVAMEELKRAARIVQRIRDLGRQTEGRRELSALGDMVQRTIVLTHERARNQGVEIVWDGDARLPLVPLVRDRIQQVFLNLTLNALDAMPEGGELRISAAPTAEPAGVGIFFADTGEGIPPETMERLFEAFYTTKPLDLGLGLGLHVSRNIIQEHGGRIDVESEVGRGTTFTVWLPTEQGE